MPMPRSNQNPSLDISDHNSGLNSQDKPTKQKIKLTS